MYHEFKLPIHYNTKKVVLKDTIKDDLEMISFKQDASSCMTGYRAVITTIHVTVKATCLFHSFCA